MTIYETITHILETQDIRGIDVLCQQLGCRNRAHVRAVLRSITQDPAVTVEDHGIGRGHKKVIRKNRNSPGYPRRAPHGRQVP